MLDPKEEQKYTRLKKLALEMGIPMPETFWNLEVFDKNGNLLQSHHQRGHSWVRNAYNLLFCQLACAPPKDAAFGAGLLNFKDVTGAVKFFATTMLSIIRLDKNPAGVGADDGYRGPVNNDNRGIVVGSGVNAESFEDYVLQTKIAQGAAAGQLNYVEGEAIAVTYAGLVMTQTLIRYFNNNSGGGVDVKEVSLGSTLAIGNVMDDGIVCRDKLTATVTVPDTGQLRVIYTIQLTYPS